MDDQLLAWLNSKPDVKAKVDKLDVIPYNMIFEMESMSDIIHKFRKYIYNLINMCKKINDQDKHYVTYLNIGKKLLALQAGKRKFNYDYYSKISKMYCPNKYAVDVNIDDAVLIDFDKLITSILSLFENSTGKYSYEFFIYESEDVNELLISIKYYDNKSKNYYKFPKIIDKINSCIINEDELIIHTHIVLNKNPILIQFENEKKTLIEAVKREVRMFSGFNILFQMMHEKCNQIIAELNFIEHTTTGANKREAISRFAIKHEIKSCNFFDNLNQEYEITCKKARAVHATSILKERPLVDLIDNYFLSVLILPNDLVELKKILNEYFDLD